MKRFWKLVQLSWSDARGARTRLLFLSLALVFGVAIIVATRLIARTLTDQLAYQGRVLLGADVSLTSKIPLSEALRNKLDHQNYRIADEVRFRSVASFGESAIPRLVQLRALEGGFPFFGEVVTSPSSAWRDLQQGTLQGVLLDKRFAAQLSVTEGSAVKIAGVDLVVAGIIDEGLQESGPSSLFAPRIYMPRKLLPTEFLSAKGGVADYVHFIKFNQTSDKIHFLNEFAALLSAQQAELTSVDDRMETLGGVAKNVTRYCTIVGLVALLIGSLGAGSALISYLKSRENTVAILRSIGATKGAVLSIFLLQIVMVGSTASLVGIALGTYLHSQMPSILKDFFPATLTLQSYPLELVFGFCMGLFVVLAVSFPALLRLCAVSPALALRSSSEEHTTKLQHALFLLAGGIVLEALTFYLLKDLKQASILTGALVAVAAVFIALAFALRIVARRCSLFLGRFSLRFGVASLYRPQNQTLITIFSLGMLCLLVQAVFIAKGLLDSQADIAGQSNRPNIFLFDIQLDQRDAIKDLITQHGGALLQEVPIVLMRIAALKGQKSRDILNDPTSTIPPWTLKRDYWNSYRSTQASNEKIIEGTWTGNVSPDTNPIPISMEDRLMQKLGIVLGDAVTWELQGVTFETVVTSKRDILWERLERNSFVIFPEGVLEDVPQFRFMATKIDDQDRAAAFSRAVAKDFPSVSFIDLSAILEGVNKVLSRIVNAIKFLALFLLLAASSVVIGATINSARSRIREATLLRTLGATRRVVSEAIFTEYFFLALLAIVSATLLSLPFGWVLAHYVFKIDFVLYWPALIWGALLLFVITTVTAAVSLQRVLREPCGALLKE